MKSYAFSNQKGGTGKTSMSVTVAAELAKNHRVIFIDCDPQGNATNWLIGDIDLHNELADYLIDKVALENITIKTPVKNLDLLPTAGLGGRLKLFADGGNAAKNPYCIADLLDELNNSYDYAILDLSPSFGFFERSILIACNEVITPIIPVSFSVDGLKIFSQNLLDAKKAMRSERPIYQRIIVNAIDSRIEQHNTYIESLKNTLTNFNLYFVKVDQIFSKAQNHNMTIQEFSGAKKENLAEFQRIAKDLI